MKIRKLPACIVLLGSLVSCSGNNDGSRNSQLSFSQKIKLKQYKVQGELLYAQHCGNCHQSDGSGLGKLIPPLTSIASLQDNRNKTMCIIKYGMEGPLVVEGTQYDGKMPANLQLTNLEIAEILTFVGNSWDNSIGIVLSSEVEESLTNCR